MLRLDGPGGFVGRLGHRSGGGPFGLRRTADRSAVAGPARPSVVRRKGGPARGAVGWVDGTGWAGRKTAFTFGRHLLVFAPDDPDERALGSPETPSGFDVQKIGPAAFRA